MSNPVHTNQSSPESFQEDQEHPQDVTTDQTAPDDAGYAPSSSELPKSPLSAQKRRRVTRACDECRRKKIKCDGKQPCTHCTVYSYDCTYDQPSNRRRNPAPQHYIDALQNRLRRAEAIIKAALPDVNLDEEDSDSNVQHRLPVSETSGLDMPQNLKSGPKPVRRARSLNDQEGDALLESMVDATGQLGLDARGHWDFIGHSSGWMFYRQLRKQHADLFGGESGEYGELFGREGLQAPPIGPLSQQQVYDSPKSSVDSPMDVNLPNTSDLPPRTVARALASNALDDACALLRFVHKPSFYTLLDRIYDLAPEAYGDRENRFLPLLYMVLALGSLFAKTDQSELDKAGYACAITQGFKYFRACRQMIDITDCRDLTSLQTVIFMVLFLQCSARLSTCYSYLGIALRAALRMGLHRSFVTQFNPVERETRKRVFWAIWKLDNYVGALLGLPKSLCDEDIDQEYPLEVKDEYITEDQILPMPEGEIALMAGVNAHTRLVKVLARVIKYIYPVTGVDRVVDARGAQTYRVNYAKVREIEQDLQAWMDELPAGFRMGGEASPDLVRVQQLLRMSYGHIQLMLYRPFLHYVAQGHLHKQMDRRSYACAAACVSICRNLVHITAEMKKRNLLNGAYWFIIYTTFFAILTLVFYALENPSDPGTVDILKDAKEGKDTIAALVKKSMAADRCTATLTTLFDQLPEKLKNSKSVKRVKKKRQAPCSDYETSQASNSNIEFSRSTEEQLASVRQPSTLPTLPTTSSSDGPTVQANGHPTLLTVGASLSTRTCPHEAFTPSDLPSDLSAVPTPDLSPNLMQLQQDHEAQFSMQQGSDLSGMPQLNAMMFPSTDPFAYPNNPMIILEGEQQKQGSSDPVMDNFMFLPDQSSNGPYDKTDVPLFGSLPPHPMQGQQLASGPQYPPEHLRTNGGLANGPQDMYAAQATNVLGIQAGFNLEDVFGSNEWSNNNLLIGHHYQQGYPY